MDDQQKHAHAEYMRQWRLDNVERAREISRVASAKFAASHPRGRATLDPERLARQRALARQQYHKRVAQNPEYLRRKESQGKQWRLANPELAKAAAREATARWRAANPEKVRAQVARSKAGRIEQQSKKRASMRSALLEFFGGVCVRCGFADSKALHLDHVHGNGNKDRRIGKGKKWDQFALIQSDPSAARERYQLLCANCNTVKQVDNREYRKGT